MLLYNLYWVCSYYVVVKISVALFNLPQYEVGIDVCSPIGTVILEPEFIISSISGGVIQHVEFRINGDSGFLINGTTSPLVVQPPYMLKYPLTVSIGSGRDLNELTEFITFELNAFVRTSSGAVALVDSNIVLRKSSE